MVCHTTNFSDLDKSTGMDLPSKNIYDTFKDEIWKDLGPLDPDWFETLTAQTSTNEGNVSDQEDLCANQEGHFKAPFDKTAAESQLFSTPKVFRHSRVVSPETEDEHSFTAEQEQETFPWIATQSPCLFQISKEEVPDSKYGGIQLQSQDSFDLLRTPQKSPHISESLGAHIHPDISWTSSLNTPVPSTLILTKTDESPCPVNVSADKNVVFVRKLFPSLSKGSRVEPVAPSAHQGVVSPVAVQSPESPQGSPSQRDSVWRQKLPDAIEDGEIRTTVASVLDGAEDVLSIFFTNSSSALRKVKTDRIKRRQTISTKEHGCSSTTVSTTNNVASHEQRIANQEPVRLPTTPPVKTGDAGITQWSPLSLSEIPPCTVGIPCHDNNAATQVENSLLTEQTQSGFESGQLVRPSVKIPNSGFTKNKRKFVYTINTLKHQAQGEETQSQKMESSSGIPDSVQEVKVVKVPNEADCCSKNEMQEQGNLTEEKVPPSVQTKIQDLDISQLSRDFAQDFSQMAAPGKLNKIEDIPGNSFSPSACLSALKQANQKARQAKHDCDGIINRKSVFATKQNSYINDGGASGDSGFQSAVADITHVTSSSFVLPYSENNGQSQQCTSLETDIHRTTPFPSTNKGKGKAHLGDVLEEPEAHAKLSSAIKESQILGSGIASELCLESTSAQLPSSAKGTVDTTNCIPLNGQVHGSLPRKTTVSLPCVGATGFKTASNKGIQISSANLERAKRLFEETEGEGILSDQPIKGSHGSSDEPNMGHVSVTKPTSNSNQPSSSEKIVDNSCQLTASQKADVTELCTLLEEADSQFEFTQFKTAKLKDHCQDNTTAAEKVDKEFDPDFLTGIDFDDSFNSDAEKHLAVTVMHDKITLVTDGETNCETHTRKSTGVSLLSAMKKEENSSTEDVSSKRTSEGSSSIMSAKTKHLDRAETSKLENKNPLMLGVGFKTAGGNALRVSKTCLSKAKALFADLEENFVTRQESNNQSSETNAQTQHKQSVENDNCNFLNHKEDRGKIVCSDRQVMGSKMDITECQSGFQMASGKEISVSAKAMQQADAFFKDCIIFDTHVDVSAKNKSKKFEDMTAGPEVAQHNVDFHNFGFKNALAQTGTASFHGNPSLSAKAPSSLSCTISKSAGSSASNDLSNGGGFYTASGAKVFMSADAMKKAESLLNDMNTLEDTNKQFQQKDDAIRTGQFANKIQAVTLKNGGFQTASGKGVSISSAALKKAKTLFSGCEGVEDKIDTKPAHSQMAVCAPPSRNHGFLAASGKPVAFSSEALQKAKALFSDISFNGDILAVSNARNSDKQQDSAQNVEKIHCGFSTAGGTNVHVSQKNLLKAKNLFKDFGDSTSSEAIQQADALKQMKSMASVGGSGNEKKNLTNLKQQRVSINIPEEPRNGHSEFENGTIGPAVNHEEILQTDNTEIYKGIYKNMLDSTNAASLHENTSLMAKPLSSLLHTAPGTTGHSAINALSNCDGFCTASGKKVSVSDDAMAKAKSLLNESATFEDTTKLKEDTLPPQTGGFQTASGKGVSISSAALKKAKTLFSECEGVEDKIGPKPAHSKMILPAPPSSNHEFLAASGKPVAFSSEALQKAKSLFSDISFSGDIPAISNIRKSDKQQDNSQNTEEIHCGFSTAGGAKVHVSQKNLLKAKNLLKDFADEDSNLYSTSPHDTFKSDLSKMKDVKRTSNPNLTTGTDKDTPTTESARHVVKSFTSLQVTDHENEILPNSNTRGCIFIKDKAPDLLQLKEDKITPSEMANFHDSPGDEMSSVLDSELNLASTREGSQVKRTEESPVLYFQSLNLTDCTETQQRFLAQEALDCTKALLQDESLAGQSLSMTLENVPPQNNAKSSKIPAEGKKGTRKRLVEDPDVIGQPPLKRRLLEEFDRTVHGPTGSTLHPEKSNPNGALKDRAVFKYSTSLHPNITRPHRNGESYVETRLQKTTTTQRSTPIDSRSAHSKTPATFVPPFFKNGSAESGKNTVLKDSTRRPAFVPPFKKQRTIVQESTLKPQEEENKHHQSVLTHFNSNSYTPPTKKAQSATDVTCHKSKEDIQMVALANTTNDNLMNTHNLPTGLEDSAAEASHVEDTFSRSQDMLLNLQNIELAHDMQDMRIRKKKRQTIRPLPGSLFLTKTSGVSRIALKAAVNGNPPARYSPKQLYGHGVHQHVYKVTSETAESFRFNLQQFIKQEAFIDGGGVKLADGGWLIPSNDGTAGKEEFFRALSDSPGVDPKLISEDWVYNHYRWIVWKKASMERSFPETMGSLCLTPEQVLLQLKYRYDVEVDHSRRPALRKIMEKDDTAAKTLVLCVCGVSSRGHSPKRHSFSDIKTPGADARVENPSAVVWLTDGWYAIKAQLDEPLTAMLHKGRLAVGGKLVIHGAQLVGSQDACSPLEAPESLMLKIYANSSRPARWDTKLGFHKDPRPFLLPVSCLYSNGGPVGCVDIIILRSYPIQWMERKPDGGVVFRSVRAEEKEARRYNSHKQKAMEILFSKIQAEFEKEENGNKKPQRRRRTISRQDIASLQDGEELYEAVENDPAYLEARLSEKQLETLHIYRRSEMEKKQAELQDRYRRALENAEEGSCPKREVTPVWRLCIADSMGQPGTVYQLNLWRPPSDLQSLLKEGCRYKVYNLTTSDGKKHGGGTTVQLTGTKKTQFQDLQASQEWLSTRFQPRVSTQFVDLQNTEFQPLCGEVDLTGYVISVMDGQGFSPAFYLADWKLNFVKVRCFSSLAQSGLEDVVKPRVLLALSNLQLRGQSICPTPVVYAGDLTVFSTNPKETHLQESLSQLRNLVQGQENFFLSAEEKLSHLVESSGPSSISSPALLTRTPASATDRRQDTKTRVTSQQPVRSLASFTPVSRNPPSTNSSTEKNPSSLKRRRALDYLSRIPSPPPLPHLGSVVSPCVNKTFNPPRRSGTPSTLSTVQTPAHRPVSTHLEDEWVNDEELAMIDTQALLLG